MSDQTRNLPHLYLSGNGESENYTSRGGGGRSLQPPIRDREAHATALQQALRKHLRIDSSKIPKHFADQSYIDK